MLSFGRNCRTVLTSCSQSCRTSTVLDEFISPATNLSLKSWRVKALAWSLIQVGPNEYLHYTYTHIQSLENSLQSTNCICSWQHISTYTTCIETRKPCVKCHQLLTWLFAGIGSEEVQPFSMSLEAEMMLEQLKEQHLQEMEDLRNQLESKVSLPCDRCTCVFFGYKN